MCSSLPWEDCVLPGAPGRAATQRLCCFLFSCIQEQPSAFYWLVSANHLMPWHEANERLSLGLLKVPGCTSLVLGPFSVTGCVLGVGGSPYPWRVFTVCVTCLLYNQYTLLSAKGVGFL
uniref:Uncharacterized protein n=1 Tax=Mus musculus TaxID=10090 RepID=Q3TRN4_MOUSE|nr:unnamed protein product [Mus musculus]BAE36993.1 unnamed protein product [Mus musculus]